MARDLLNYCLELMIGTGDSRQVDRLLNLGTRAEGLRQVRWQVEPQLRMVPADQSIQGLCLRSQGWPKDNRILGRVNKIKGLLLLVLMDGKSQGLSGLCYSARFQRSAIQCRNC